MKPNYFTLFTLLFSVILFTSCGESPEQDQEVNNRPDFSETTIVQTELLFQITEFNEGDFFANVASVFPAAGETILVSDHSARKIFKFDESGNYKGSFGREGEGPGEFRQLGLTSMLGPDTLMTMDWQLARITLFGYDQNKEAWKAARYMDRPAGSREYGESTYFAFNGLSPYDDGYIARFNSSFTPVDTATYSRSYFTHLDYDLNPQSDREYLMHVTQKPLVVREGNGVSVGGIPENHRLSGSITDDGRFISSWSEGRDVSVQHIISGDSTGFSFPSARHEIDADRKREMAAEHIPNPEQAMFTREQLIERIPDYYGYSRGIITDDENRIWIHARPFEDDDPDWLVFDMDGNLLFAAHHPGGSIHEIKNNRIYASITSEDGEPGFAVFGF